MNQFSSICLNWKSIAAFLALPVLAILGLNFAGTVGILLGVAIGGGLIGYILCDLEKKQRGSATDGH